MVTEKQLSEAREVLDPLDRWHHDCHGASVTLVRAKLWPCRVARGVCKGIGSQHSWVVLGDDCYAPDADIIDPTLWSYDDDVIGIWGGSMESGLHIPHGTGDIWKWGKPVSGGGEPIELTPPDGEWSDDATLFLELLGPLDREGWAMLAHAPVGGWPAAEILPAIEDTVGPLVPIDIIGMLTDRNPADSYLP